ncbi:hypothetical protein C4D60_Mb09t08970 [Musa balbisiana]|uniref:Uncharacterized protein n=1 Tax=Musa balbisiana TaxID=52838 RepID=A0A4S8IF37_MUSBA|nr:hypothetical protein C4D60_Mb09t08970 [Musa balbisiana]
MEGLYICISLLDSEVNRKAGSDNIGDTMTIAILSLSEYFIVGIARTLKLRYAGDSSGSAASPSKYPTTCRMLGRPVGSGCEHSNPSFRTSSTSSITYSFPSLGSLVASIDPFRQFSTTQSNKISSSPDATESTGRLPQATSKRKTPNANTSVMVVALPVRTSSGAR